MKIFQLHSEYRSTYRWHEYTPKQQNTVVRTAPVPQPLTSSGISLVLENGLQYWFDVDLKMPFLDGSEFSRGRKKAPDVAYKCHEFFDVKSGGSRSNMDAVVDSRITRVGVSAQFIL